MPKLSLQAEEELKAARSQQAGQLQEMERREHLLRSDVQRAGEQVWNGRDGNITTGAMGSTGMWLPMGKDVLWKQKPSVLSTKPYHGTYLVIG